MNWLDKLAALFIVIIFVHCIRIFSTGGKFVQRHRAIVIRAELYPVDFLENVAIVDRT